MLYMSLFFFQNVIYIQDYFVYKYIVQNFQEIVILIVLLYCNENSQLYNYMLCIYFMILFVVLVCMYVDYGCQFNVEKNGL